MGPDCSLRTTALGHACGKSQCEDRKSGEHPSWVFAPFWQVCRKLFFPVSPLPTTLFLPFTPPTLYPKDCYGIPREAHGSVSYSPESIKEKIPGTDSLPWGAAQQGPKTSFAKFASEVMCPGTLGAPWLLIV
jgi:hypothetical protein